jgi:RNA exonuclease 1
VDGVNPSEVLLDSLVAPNWPISEMRTRIHGIAESNLTGVTFTLRHAQAFLMKVCSDQTIIVGHALHHDLRALKLQHKYVSSSFFPSPPSLPLSRDLSL